MSDRTNARTTDSKRNGQHRNPRTSQRRATLARKHARAVKYNVQGRTNGGR